MNGIGDWIREMVLACERMCELGALEGTAGNISLFLPSDTPDLDGWMVGEMGSARRFDPPSGLSLPPGVLIISGTGRRLRDIATSPESVLCALVMTNDAGCFVHCSPDTRVEPTSEIDSHVAIHADALGGVPGVHTVLHAQPPKLSWLSHIAAYREVARLNRQLLRWQPETIVTFPEGIGVLPFVTPGTPAQGTGTAVALRTHRLVVWAKHGVVARSPHGPQAAADLIDYAEAAAGYEVMDILAGRRADGLTLDEMRAVARRYGVSDALLQTLPEGVLAAGE